MGWTARVLAIGVIGLVGLAVYVVLEPVAIFGYDGDALSESLEGKAPSSYGRAECKEHPGGWLCDIETDPGSGFGASYTLTASDAGCWEATPVRYGKPPIPKEQVSVSGCVDVIDLIGFDLME